MANGIGIMEAKAVALEAAESAALESVPVPSRWWYRLVKKRLACPRTLLAACAAAPLIGACSKGPTCPIADGYTLHAVATARNATRLEAYRYRLEVELDPAPAPYPPPPSSVRSSWP